MDIISMGLDNIRLKQSENHRRWREKYPERYEEAKANARAWKKAHPDRHREINKRWYENNKQKARESSKRWEGANPDKAREVRRRYYKRHPECIKKFIEWAREWKKNNKDKVRAHKILARAVEGGKILKPDTCSVCNSKDLIEGHHPDYSKPLEVMWVCKSCHGKISGGLV